MQTTKINIGNRHIFPMYTKLKENLDRLKNANNNDWDFKIIISGDGMTRTGKTTLGAQIGIYLDPAATEENWCYDGRKLKSLSKKLGKSRVLIYDEARESLDSQKAINTYAQRIVDYFNECGYLNQYLIVILPDFFDLNKSVALNLSICLLNCRITGEFQRGCFEFYNRKDKRQLYIKGKKFKDYSVHNSSFNGFFSKYFPFDYKALENIKEIATHEREKAVVEKRGQKNTKNKLYINQATKRLKNIHKWNTDAIAKLFGVTTASVRNWLNTECGKENEPKTD